MMFEDSYKVVTTPGEGLYKEKGSKFFAEAFPVHSEAEVKAKVAEIKKKYFDAKHHCYAFIIGPDKSCYRSSDDGEPSGTAGKPILNQILSKDLTNVCVVVTRYFGGQLLGVPGLINAYKTSAREALDNCGVMEKTVDEVYSVSFGYPLLNEVMRILKEENLEQRNTKFELDCYLEIAVRKSISNKIVDKLDRIYGVEVNYLKTI
ncbi:MAG: YigZ family protein [Bacteroidales bacterium]|nr:YigZ family protein [Bacteroidales bacterium]MDD7277695.1 YigZ family protein [Bacteroidales bacterium]MDY6074148.1 YigZ family protein [Bacteroidales bacterium]